MINISKKIAEISKDLESGNCSPSDAEYYSSQVADLKSVLTWLMDQCSMLRDALYDNETKELQMTMQNTTSYFFRTIKFAIETGDSSTIPIFVTDWKPNDTKTITFYHDFNNDEGYKTRKSIKLSINVDSVEYELQENEEEKRVEFEFSPSTDFSKFQGYLTIVRSFCDTTNDYGLRAKARMLEDHIITIYDRVSMKPELASKIGRLEEIYLPTICKTLDNYVDVINKRSIGTNSDTIVDNVNDVLDTAVAALRKIKDSLYSTTALETEVDTLLMKDMMREDGLI